MSWIEQVPFPGPWRRSGACLVVPTEVFFPVRGQSLEPAKAVCRACPVVNQCREYALGMSDLKGIWGGLGEEERQRLRRRTEGDPSPEPPSSQPPAARPRPRRRGALYGALEELTVTPQCWARVAWYPGIHTAGGMAARLRAGMVTVPEGNWQFEARDDGSGSGLWARYTPASGEGTTADITS